jgi:glycosyltransferase involved in cell wall biosynthesis
MKVLLAAYICQPNLGSEHNFGWNWSLHLAEFGHEVWVLTYMDNQPAIQEELAAQPISNLHFIYIDDPFWIKICRRYFNSNTIWLIALRYLAWQKRAYNAALQLDKNQAFDIVHHVTMSNLQAGSWLCHFNKPFIFGPVGGGQVAPSAFKKYFLKGWTYEVLRFFVLKHLGRFNPLISTTVSRTDLVLATNRDTANLASNSGARRVELFLDAGLPQDYPVQESFSRSTSQELRLLWVARLDPRKGLLIALEALSKVSPSVSFKLTIIGDGVLRDYLPEWIKEFGLESQVEYLASVPWTEVKKKYLNNDVFLFTSLRDSFGSVILEAMSQALPVITLDHQGAGDFVPDDAGIKVPVTNPADTVKALAQAVEWMYKNPDKRLEMGKIAWDFANTQTWAQKTLKMSNYYEEIVLHS